MIGVLATMLGTIVGCSPLPEVAYETERLQIAPEFDAPICEGTLAALDEHLRAVEEGLGQIGKRDPYRLYWMVDGLDEVCGEGRGGCFFPATRMMFARGGSITHEMTHAALDSEGESYFIEEGMAELLSGVGVYYEGLGDDEGPGQRLRLSRSAYRAGHFDYDAAGHFMRYVYDRRGQHGVRRLAAEVEAGASPERIEATLEQVMGERIDAIEADYRAKSSPAYEGLGYEQTLELMVKALDDDPHALGPERLSFEVAVDLDCGAEDTMGPLPDEREGMYQVRRVVIPQNEGALLRVEGDPGTWVDVFNPHARARHGLMTDWMRPDPEIDGGALRLYPGDALERPLLPGVRAVVLAAEGTGGGSVSLHVELTPVPLVDPVTRR
ncbi:hypothetical protein [Paraliomyxa miuraensis]|uniref:hypothetical protein n=1 Tax=Paraliomyxa miuraensis TaxID=376150 RepID=UPI0022588BCE|nr:hypothetical protein [Paraliomyxa miuraensis]MCX4239545.1 hypothetical protein [Paraliomyxa miuraensis]